MSLRIIEIISERQTLLISLLKGHCFESHSRVIPPQTQRPYAGEGGGGNQETVNAADSRHSPNETLETA